MSHHHHSTRTTLALVLGACLLATAAHAEERLLRKKVRTEHGTAAAVAGEGAQGRDFIRGRRTHVDEEGNVVSGRAAAVQNDEGGRAVRAGRIVRAPDGTLTRQAGFAADGARGNIQSQGQMTRTPDGDVSGERSTSATGAQGNTYQGQTSYSKGEGIEHSATCTDAAGSTVPCRR